MQSVHHRPSIIINLDLGDEKKVLKIFEGEDLYQVAKDFCEKEGLSEDCIEFLVETISEEYERKKSQRSSAMEEKVPENEDKFRLSFGNNSDAFQSGTLNEIAKPFASQTYEEDKYNFVKETPSKPVKESSIQNIQSNWAINDLYQSSKSFGNDTNSRLYYQGKKKMDRVTENTKNHKTEIEKEMLKECTFSPNLRKGKSKSPVSKITSNEVTQKVSTNIKDYFRKKKKFEELRQESELKNCSFKPKISKNSTRIATENSKDFPGLSYQEKLYNKCQSKSRERQEDMQKEFNKIYTFHPTIHPKITPSKNVSYLSNTSRSRCSQKSENSELINKFGKEESMFHPKINKDSHYYKVKLAHEQELRELEEKKRKEKARSSLERSKSKGKVIMREPTKKSPLKKPLNITPKASLKKTESTGESQEIASFLKRFFDILDDDNDGIISPEKISLSTCTLEMLQAYESVFEKIDELNQEFDFNSFVSLIYEQPRLVKFTQVLMKGENLKLASEDENLDSTEIHSSKHSYTFSFGDFGENRKILEGLLKKQDFLMIPEEENTPSKPNKCLSPLTRKYSRLADSSFKK